MGALDRKLIRDFRRLWAQALAVALVLACGVATLILAIGAYRSLEETRRAYYERYRFGDVFASATRAPDSLGDRIREIDGIAGVELRIVEPLLLDISGMGEPATGVVVSLPETGEPEVNAIFLRQGRLPEDGHALEVVVNEDFAEAHHFLPGSSFHAIMNGAKTELTIVGIALSPEYVYALGPGDLMPDARRFGVIWMSVESVGPLFDLEDAFNSVSLKLLPGASEASVIDALDGILAPYGGTGTYGRRDQISHAFLDGELTQLSAMARIIPPIFLLVSAFLINMILSRLIALEREQIGLLKALGYRSSTIAWHYLKLVLLIAGVGIVIGFVAGTLLGRGLTTLYARFYSFPFLIFRSEPDVYAIAAGISVAAAALGAMNAVYSVMRLAPAVAMRAPAPPSFNQFLGGLLGQAGLLSQLSVMALRQLLRWPARAALSMIGTSLSVALLVVALFSFDSVEFMVDVLYSQSDRQDATMSFADERPPSVMSAVHGLPGVLAAEPFRNVAVKMRNGPRERRISIVGKPPGTDLSRVLDLDLRPVVLPETGVALGERVADILDLRRGDLVEVEFLEGERHKMDVPVTEIIQSYLGLSAFMDLDALNRLAGEGPRLSGVYLAVDGNALDRLFRSVKETPVVSGLTLRSASRQRFDETVRGNITIMVTVYVTLSVIIAFGVIYNSARIQLSERARELATLRVIGFTRREVSQVLLTELTLIVLLAQPLGWAIGFGFAVAVIAGFDSDLFRVPLVVSPETFAYASLVVLASAAVSALIVRRRVDRFDLVQVLKTRE